MNAAYIYLIALAATAIAASVCGFLETRRYLIRHNETCRKNGYEIPSRLDVRSSEWILRAALPFLPSRYFPQLLILGHKAVILRLKFSHFCRVTPLKVRIFLLKQTTALLRRRVHPLGSVEPGFPPSGAKNHPSAAQGGDAAKTTEDRS